MPGTDKGRCPSPWLPSTPSEFGSSLEGREDSSPCLPGGWQSSAAVPACCLADGEIISKPFPFPPPPSLAGPHWLSPWDSVQSLPLKQDSWPGSLPPRTPQPSHLAGKGASRSFQTTTTTTNHPTPLGLFCSCWREKCRMNGLLVSEGGKGRKVEN